MLNCIRGEITESLELDGARRLGQRRFQPGIANLQRIRIQVLVHVIIRTRIRHGEQAIVKTHFGWQRVFRRHPVDRPLDLAITGCATAFCLRIQRATKFDHASILGLDDVFTLDDVGKSQPDFTARFQAEKFSRRLFHKVILLDIQLARKRHFPRAEFGTVGMIDCRHHLGLALGEIGQHDFERLQHGHAPHGIVVEVFANAVLEHAHLDKIFLLGHADT